jgi:hypothetical protein
MQGNRNPFIDRPEFAERMLSTAIAVPLQVGAPIFTLGQNAPNPFGPVTRIPFVVPAGTTARISVYDAAGRLVATVLDAPVPAGRHEVTWDARNRAGAAVTAGVYFYRIEAGEHHATKRMVLVR